jgi:hypothetical protein
VHEATYPKRAKGLVKQGRARFIDESTICLLNGTCPANNPLEDKPMNMPNILDNQEIDILTEAMKGIDPRSNGPRPGVPPAPPVPPVPPAPPLHNTMHELLNRIDAIIQNTAHIHEAVNSIRDMVNGGELCEDTAETVIHGVVDVVKAREHTNQSAISLLKEMYNNTKSAKSKSITNDLVSLGGIGLDIEGLVSSLPPGEKLSFIRELLGFDN